eukprot:1397909-Rhodomonas_salina.1
MAFHMWPKFPASAEALPFPLSDLACVTASHRDACATRFQPYPQARAQDVVPDRNIHTIFPVPVTVI